MPTKFTDETIAKLFGNEEAEREDPTRLMEYFVKNNVYDRVRANIRLRVLVGYKGVGKSALFKVCDIEDKTEKIVSIWIRPDDISTIAIEKNEDINRTIKEWKIGIQNLIFGKVAEAAGFVEELSNNKSVVAYGKGFLGSLLAFLNERAGSKLAPLRKSFIQNFTARKKLVVYLDDLDRGWTGQRSSVFRMSALLNAIRDIIADGEGIYFRIALRSDVYYIVRRTDPSTDKIEGDVIWLQWNNDDIFRVLVKRVATFLGKGMELVAFNYKKQAQLSRYLVGIFEPVYAGRGLWEHKPTYQVILSLVRAKPRDMILLCSGAARLAGSRNHTEIKSQDIGDSLRADPESC
jgi:hypothetical protein